jgi:large subunit ribosomal protein L13
MTKEKKQFTIDATGKRLGRLATEIATILMGKNSPDMAHNVVADVFVKIENADKLHITEKKKTEKKYKRYTGYPGGLREIPMKKVIEKKGYEEVIRKAVYGMLPGNRLRSKRMKRLIISK